MLNQQLVLGRTYRFKFKSEFEAHGVCSTSGITCLHQGEGVFTLEQISSFADMVKAGVKLYDSFFKPLGITEDEYAAYFDGKPSNVFEPTYTTQSTEVQVTDVTYETQTINGVDTVVPVNTTVTRTQLTKVPTGNSTLVKEYITSLSYANYPIYKLVDVVDKTDIIYVPELAINGFPEVDINEYSDITLAIRLGYFQETAMLDPLLQSIKDKLALYGIQYDNVNAVITDTKWMSTPEYEEIKEARAPGTRTIITSSNRADCIGKFIVSTGELVEITAENIGALIRSEVNPLNVNNINTHLGKTFEFVNDAGITETVELSADEVTLATIEQLNNITLVADDTTCFNAYKGLTFSYVPTSGDNANTLVTVTLPTTQVEFNAYAGCTGTIHSYNVTQPKYTPYLGKTGYVYKVVYIQDDSKVSANRNYYYLYLQEQNKNAKLAAQVEALEAIVREFASN